MKSQSKSKIILVDSCEQYLENNEQLFDDKNHILINEDEFKIENAREAVRVAYISSDEEKIIHLVANKFNVFAQNALLKVLEEPPRNIIFYIVTTSKSALLPTIRSRMIIDNQLSNSLPPRLDIDFNKLDLETIFNLVLENKSLERSEAKEFLESMLVNLTEQKIKLNDKVLEKFDTSIDLLALNGRVETILLSMLLSVYKEIKRHENH